MRRQRRQALVNQYTSNPEADINSAGDGRDQISVDSSDPGFQGPYLLSRLVLKNLTLYTLRTNSVVSGYSQTPVIISHVDVKIQSQLQNAYTQLRLR